MGPARPRVIADGRSSLVLHGVLMSACACSSREVLLLCELRRPSWSTADVSRFPDTRSALLNARRRSARLRQLGSRCSHAPRPGSLRDTSGTSGEPSGPCSPTTTLNRSTADPCSLHPTHVLTGEPGFTRAESEDSRRTIVHSTAEPSRSLHSTVIRWTWRAGRTHRQRVPHRSECRYANPSTVQPGGHFDPLFRWPTKAGNRAR